MGSDPMTSVVSEEIVPYRYCQDLLPLQIEVNDGIPDFSVGSPMTPFEAFNSQD
jgi:hypothetical protein